MNFPLIMAMLLQSNGAIQQMDKDSSFARSITAVIEDRRQVQGVAK
jgi:hypothetical protein